MAQSLDCEIPQSSYVLPSLLHSRCFSIKKRMLRRSGEEKGPGCESHFSWFQTEHRETKKQLFEFFTGNFASKNFPAMFTLQQCRKPSFFGFPSRKGRADDGSAVVNLMEPTDNGNYFSHLFHQGEKTGEIYEFASIRVIYCDLPYNVQHGRGNCTM